MTNDNTQQNPKKFNCEDCKFRCSNKKDYNRHILTAKHTLRINMNEKNPINTKPVTEYKCVCKKKFKHASSLWNHKQKCNLHKKEETNEEEKESSQEIQNTVENEISYKDMFLELMKQNQELQKTVIDQQKQYADTIYKFMNKNGND